MALSDIVFGGTASMITDNFIMNESRGNIGVISDVLAPSGGSSANTMQSKIPKSNIEVSVTFIN